LFASVLFDPAADATVCALASVAEQSKSVTASRAAALKYLFLIFL
jgi:hypothetical protein